MKNKFLTWKPLNSSYMYNIYWRNLKAITFSERLFKLKKGLFCQQWPTGDQASQYWTLFLCKFDVYEKFTQK